MSAAEVVEAACAFADAKRAVADTSDVLPLEAFMPLIEARRARLAELMNAVAAYRADATPVAWTTEEILRREA